MRAWLKRRARRWYVKHYLTEPDDECKCGACFPID